MPFRYFFYFLVMTALRKEACFILVLLPLIALMFGREARLKKFLIHSGLVVLVFVFYVAFGSSVYGTKSTNQYFGNYNMTSVLRTVSYILVNQSEPLNQKDQKFVDSLVKVEELKKIPDIINMEYFTWYQPTSNEGMIQFYVFAARLIFNNLNLFFQFRTEIFKRNLDIPIVATPYLRDGPDYEFFPQFMQTQQKFFLRTKSLLTEENIFADYYRNSVQTGTLTFKFSSPIFSILILFTMMICFRMTPISSTVATVPILHSLLVYLFQPGLGTKHYFLAYISSFLIVVFFIFELRSYFRDDVKVLQQ